MRSILIASLAKSPRIGNILDNWEKYESDEPHIQRPRAGSMAVPNL